MDNKPFGFYFLLFIILVLWFKLYAIIYVFLPAMATACVLAYLTNPVYTLINKRLGHASLSALLVIFMIFTLFLMPVTLILYAVQNQVQEIMTQQTIEYVRGAMHTLDQFIFRYLERNIITDYVNQLIPRILSGTQQLITTFGPQMLMSATRLLLSTFIALFLMYYLLINSRRVIETIRYYGPLSDRNIDILMHEMGRDTRTLILGQLLIAAVQGSLAAIGYLIFGISGVLLWGVVTAIVSFIPVLGAGIVWFPASIFLMLQNEMTRGIGLMLWGILVVSTSDNLIRPKLTSLFGEIHPVTVLLGVIIGIAEWGVIGIVLGPLMISVLIILIKMFREQYLEA